METWLDGAKAREACASIFRIRVEASLADVKLPPDPKSVLAMLANSLPEAEKEILRSAAREAPVRELPDGRLASADRAALRSSITRGFRTSGRCGRQHIEYEIYAFADAVNQALTAKGLDVESIFFAQWDETGHRDPLLETVIVLALALEAEKAG